MFALTTFYRFIQGRGFTKQTDNRPLLAILGFKKDLPAHTANRFQRWRTILFDYNFRMGFLPSSNMYLADRLSRLIRKNSKPLKDIATASLQSEVGIKKYYQILSGNNLRFWKKYRNKALHDSFIVEMKTKLKDYAVGEKFFLTNVSDGQNIGNDKRIYLGQ